jgi:hypothetical protein
VAKVYSHQNKGKDAEAAAHEAAIKGDKGVVIPPEKRLPNDPENIHLTKAEFVAKRKVEKERALKIAEYARKLESGEIPLDEQGPKAPETAPSVDDAPEPEAPKKKAGRPKKAE